MILLADAILESSTAPKGLSSWLENLLFVAGLVYVGILIFKELRGKTPHPPNSELQQAVKQITETLESHINMNRQDHRDLFSGIGGVERGSLAKIEEVRRVAREDLERAIESGNVSREKLHERINDLLKAISHLEGKIEG